MLNSPITKSANHSQHFHPSALMALPRLCIPRLSMKNTLLLSPHLPSTQVSVAGLGFGTRRMPSLSLSCSAASSSSNGQGAAVEGRDGGDKEITVAEGASSPSRRRGARWGFLPFQLGDGGLGNALLHVSDNLYRVLENWKPNRWLGRAKEEDQCYKLRFEVPGLSKEDLKISVDSGFLVISGEHKEEEDGFDDDDSEGWFSRRFYNTSLLLPDDAEVEGIKAEVKDGILKVTIPRSKEKKDVKEVEIH